MTNTNKILGFIFLIFLVSSCTGDFEDMNKNPYEVSNESLLQDFNQIGSYYPEMLNNIFGEQVENNLVNDSFIRHLATPTPFEGERNNTTYYITWNSYWNRIYDDVLAPASQVIDLAEEEDQPVFVAWAKLIRVIAASRITAHHGPIIYSNFGSSDQSIKYDSEEDLYNTFFAELDEILDTFKANVDFDGLEDFDATYEGNIENWIKATNSLRLRLAMRLSNVKPDLAKTEGEKAILDEGGLISNANDDFFISLYSAQFHPSVIAYSWDDTRMSATMESVLIGYEDNRISSFFEPATDESSYSDHPDFPYKGIRNGAELGSKDKRTGFSNISKDFLKYTERPFFMASEVEFLLAEAALRGWNGAGSAQEHYEEGVRQSFDEWGAIGADDYLDNDSGLPLDYHDPQAAGDINDFESRIKISVKWDEAASNEVKLERIMTQKWIAGFMNSVETWVDHRRTGYPKLPYNYKNESSSTWGKIADDDFLRRMPFVQRERENNPSGVSDATDKLGGPDEIGTRLWWDVDGPNF